MSVAERIAEQMGNDGTVYERGAYTLDGQARGCARAVTTADQDGVATPGGWSPDAVRYEFADGSAIIDGGAGWDIEGSEPWTWAGVEVRG